MTREQMALAFDIVTTLDDSVALQNHLNASLRPKGGGLRKPLKRPFGFWPMFIVFFALMFIGIVTSDQTNGLLNMLFNSGSGAKIAVELAADIMLFGFVPFTFIRWSAKRRIRRYHASVRASDPDTDPRDPTLSTRRSIRFDEDGVHMKSRTVELWESWRRITGLEETPDILVLRVGKAVGYALPKRDLSSELQESLHLYVAERCASKWPF